MKTDLFPGPHRHDVLLGETHDLTARAVTRILEASGCRVARVSGIITSEDPREFDACLVAARLGSDSGAHLIRDLRHRGATAPIVALAGWTDSGRRQEFIDAGADAFLLKPCSADQITDCLRRLLLERHPEITRASVIAPDRANPLIPILFTALVGGAISLTLWLLQ